MPEWTLYEWLVVVLTTTTAVVAVLAWRLPKQGEGFSSEETTKFRLYPGKELPAIHAANGIPTLRQLMEGIEADPKMLGVAEHLYQAGLAQFNHYVNNRDGVIETSRGQMANLTNCLDQSEVALAESIGISMASDEDDDQREVLRAQYDDLAPQAQIYAQHKRQEIDALARIARDLEKDVPRTDYTSVKARIASGAVTLDSVMSELPVFWQDLRTLNKRVESPKPRGKPPKRKFLRVIFLSQADGLLEDKRAQRDGEWIVSDKHGLMFPYQEPVPIYEHIEEGKSPVQKGEVVVFCQNPTSEWATEYWRQGGRLDQLYIRAKNGMSPEQLWGAYRRRLIRNFGWGLAGGITLLDIAIIVVRYL